MERLTGHGELQEVLGAYALDAVDPAEAVVIELHLQACPRCRHELAEHREVAALLGYAGGPAPGGVWDRIISSLEEPPPALELTRARTPTPAPTPPGPPADADFTLGGPGAGARSADGGAGTDEPAEHWRTLRPAPPAADQPHPPGQWPVRPWVGRQPGGPPKEDPVVVPITSGSPRPAAGPVGETGTDTPVAAPPGARSGLARFSRLGVGSRRPQKTVPLRLVVAIASTAALLVAALGIEIGHLETRNKSQPSNPLASLVYQVAQADPRARHVTLRSGDGTITLQAIIVPDGETYLGPSHLETLPSSETYQMWGIVNGDEVSLGVIGDNATYAAFTTPPVATALAMTIEVRGGVPSTTKTPVVEGVLHQ